MLRTYISQVKEKIGEAADVSSTTSLFGRIKQVYDLAVLIGTPADASTVDTVFGRIKKLQEKVDTLPLI